MQTVYSAALSDWAKDGGREEKREGDIGHVELNIHTHLIKLSNGSIFAPPFSIPFSQFT